MIGAASPYAALFCHEQHMELVLKARSHPREAQRRGSGTRRRAETADLNGKCIQLRMSAAMVEDPISCG